MLLVREFHVSMDYMSIAAITFLSYVIGMLPLLPGSIGSFESAMVALLSIRGVSMEMGISIAFIFRFVTFWFEFIISCFILLLDILFARKGEKMLGLKYNKISKLHILPNLITYINMSLGAVAIFISSNGSPNNIKIAAMLILIAGLTDKLDGLQQGNWEWPVNLVKSWIPSAIQFPLEWPLCIVVEYE